MGHSNALVTCCDQSETTTKPCLLLDIPFSSISGYTILFYLFRSCQTPLESTTLPRPTFPPFAN